MNVEAMKRYIKRSLRGKTDKVIIKRDGLNEFKETITDMEVTTIDGFYTRVNSFPSIKVKDGGSTTSDAKERLVAIIDEKSKLIKENDYFELKGKKFKITDLGNICDIYFNMSLERV